MGWLGLGASGLQDLGLGSLVNTLAMINRPLDYESRQSPRPISVGRVRWSRTDADCATSSGTQAAAWSHTLSQG